MIDTSKYYKENNSLDDYFMKPTYADGIGLIYPILLKDYDDFKKLFDEYLLLDIKKLNNLKKQNLEMQKNQGLVPFNTKFEKIPYDNLYDFTVSKINEINEVIDKNSQIFEEYKEKLKQQNKLLKFLDEKTKEEIINNESYKANLKIIEEGLKIPNNTFQENLCKLFEYCLRCKVKFKNNEFFMYKDNEVIGSINKDNLDMFRKIVMYQNLIFEPRVASNLRSQYYIDKEISLLFKDSREVSLESMIAFISSSGNNIDIDNITYYRFKADYEMELRKLNYITFAMYRANGCKDSNGNSLPMPSITEPLSVHINPYTKNAKIIEEKPIFNKENEVK